MQRDAVSGHAPERTRITLTGSCIELLEDVTDARVARDTLEQEKLAWVAERQRELHTTASMPFIPVYMTVTPELLADLSEERAGREQAEQARSDLSRAMSVEQLQNATLHKKFAEREQLATEASGELARAEQAVRESKAETEQERQTRREAEEALEAERQERMTLQRTLKGISPVVVPALLEAFARVSQLTDKVL